MSQREMGKAVMLTKEKNKSIKHCVKKHTTLFVSLKQVYYDEQHKNLFHSYQSHILCEN